jgi:hypothetical protein
MTEQNTQAQAKPSPGGGLLRTGLIGLIALLVFVASYQIAGAVGGRNSVRTGSAQDTAGALVPAVAGGNGAGSAACACCANSGTGETIEGTAVLNGDVQTISVDVSNGYAPNVIRLAAGVPAEITFGQGSGCMAEVMSEDLGFFEDLTGGPVTVRLEGLAPGTYSFSCGMQMVFGQIVVE